VAALVHQVAHPKPLYPFDPAQLTVDTAEGAGLAGVHAKTAYKAADGSLWLFKPQEGYRAQADVATSALAKLVGFDQAAAETYSISIGGKTGSIQRMFGTKATRRAGFTGGTFDPSRPDASDVLQLQKHAVFDWLISNHDGHKDQFVRVSGTNRQLFGIDKGQAFKFFGKDKLDYAYNPNSNVGVKSVYNELHQAYAEGRSVNLTKFEQNSELQAFIAQLQGTDDAAYRAALQPYAEQAAKAKSLATSATFKNDVEAFLDAAIARKNNLLADWKAYYARLQLERDEALKPPPPPPGMHGMQGAREFSSDDAGQKWARATFKSPKDSGFTAAETAALKSYKGNGYTSINNSLRRAGSVDASVPAIDSALAKTPLQEDLILLRGVDRAAIPQDPQNMPGQLYRDPGYMSSSVGITPAFKREIWFRIRAPKGMPTYHADQLGLNTSERELVIPRGTTFYVHSAKQEGGHWLLEMEVISHSPAAPGTVSP
jgi:hypothetical protein